MFFYVQINHYLFSQIYHFNFCSKIAPVINNLFTIYHNPFFQINIKWNLFILKSIFQLFSNAILFRADPCLNQSI